MSVRINYLRFDVVVLITALVIDYFTGHNAAWMLGIFAGVTAGRINT